ncbi:MAG: Yolk protein 1 [Paenibacillus sp.]|nr:Yolk protein 1 [Paenibacillus sp.]
MGIVVTVKAGANASTSSVSASGYETHIITDQERGSFGIKGSQLKDAVKAYYGKKPSDVYVHSPTPWNDLYKRYDWEQVRTTLTASSAKILEVTSEPVIISTKTFTNNSSKSATFNASISDQVENTVESNWSQSSTVTAEQSIHYEIGFLGTGGGGETSLSYSHTWGTGGSKSQTITVGTDTGVSVELDPGETVVAELSASRGKMKVEVKYVAYLTGQTAVNYENTYKGHHFYGMKINSVMNADNIPTRLEFKEVVEIGYYSDSQIVIHDGGGKLKQFYEVQPGADAE